MQKIPNSDGQILSLERDIRKQGAEEVLRLQSLDGRGRVEQARGVLCRQLGHARSQSNFQDRTETVHNPGELRCNLQSLNSVIFCISFRHNQPVAYDTGYSTIPFYTGRSKSYSTVEACSGTNIGRGDFRSIPAHHVHRVDDMHKTICSPLSRSATAT